MAVCPRCHNRYGLLGLNRRAIVQRCPECGWDPSDPEDREVRCYCSQCKKTVIGRIIRRVAVSVVLDIVCPTCSQIIGALDDFKQ